jgi:hypothetical protein
VTPEASAKSARIASCTRLAAALVIVLEFAQHSRTDGMSSPAT